MKFFFILILTIMLVLAVYLFFFVHRILCAFGADLKKKRYIALGIALTVAAVAAVMATGGFGAVIILHVVAIELLVKFVSLIIRLIAGEKFKDGFTVWKKVCRTSAIPIVLTVVIMLAGYYNMNNVVETRYTVYTDKSIRSEGYRIALIADVHFGVSLDESELYEKCEEISKKDADIVVLVGDIVDNSTTSEGMRNVFKALGGIRSKYGVFYTFGNHDKPTKHMQGPFTEEELISTITDNGITILEDDVYPVTDDLVLVGRADKSDFSGQGRMEIADLLAEADHSDFILTLDHQPNQYKENGEAGTDLLLSGHTHSGQFFPVNYLMEVIPFNDGVYGEYRIDGDSVAIVTSGFAAWGYPTKTAGPSEYVIIDVKNPE